LTPTPMKSGFYTGATTAITVSSSQNSARQC
jgi:hypothetical protein